MGSWRVDRLVINKIETVWYDDDETAAKRHQQTIEQTESRALIIAWYDTEASGPWKETNDTAAA